MPSKSTRTSILRTKMWGIKTSDPFACAKTRSHDDLN
jgi:hypothetical protein